MGEFELIARYFKRASGGPPPQDSGAVLGIGDDCALLQPRPGMQLAISSDMLVEGRHFLSTVHPARLGHKALAVNLSDLAACGARPLAFTLALALPQADEAWLEPFSQGLLALADAHGCALIGGDTTRGPLNICITVFGEVPVVDGKSQALLRSGAKTGDDIWVSGTLGDARLALEVFRGQHALAPQAFERARMRLEQPTPQVTLGLALRGVASAAIDISDGLLGDLAHILRASQVGACIDTAIVSNLLASNADGVCAAAGISAEQQLDYVLAGGDDYELAFCAPVAARNAVLAAATQAHTPVTRIGVIESTTGLRLVDAGGTPVNHPTRSFDHFA